jgi:class 3 adenylate cyclase
MNNRRKAAQLQNTSPLAAIESRLRGLLPAQLYAATWIDPSPDNLIKVFEHLRTLQRILHDYIPSEISDNLPKPGHLRYGWKEGALMFTDLAGFTPLMEANLARGQGGAEVLLKLINRYFSEMIEVVSKAGGYLLEFTGDALLIEFSGNDLKTDTMRAVRVGLRMQRVMANYARIDTPEGAFSLGMRVGIHAGRFLSADVGTPRRMEHILMGIAVRETKRTEGAGRVNRVNMTLAAHEHVADEFRFEPGDEGYMLVVDDFSDEQLGEYDILLSRRRASSSVLLDRSVEGLISEIESSLVQVEPLASYLPSAILNMVVENAARRIIPPRFPVLITLFVNLIGISDAADRTTEAEEPNLVAGYSRALALIDATIDARGGVLKHVTYHLAGSDILIYFGFPNAHTDDAYRACQAALALREIVNQLPSARIGGESVKLTCQIGMAIGSVFAAEIGEPRGRREFNILGDSVNTAARLMGKAGSNQILMTEELYNEVSQQFVCQSLGAVKLKGKAQEQPVYALESEKYD